MAGMTTAERDAFLLEARVAVLGLGREGKGPLLAPMWFIYRPEGHFEFCLGGSTAKAHRLRAEGRATVCVHADDFPYRYVLAEGPVTLTPLGPDTKETIRTLASRYLGEAGGRRYADQFTTPDEVLVILTPERWKAEIPGR
jgi:PPOX class probable F420-dependent enzyme